MTTSFRKRLAQGEDVFGIFAKTASHQTVEVLGRSGLDFIVIDAEHAPFSRSDLDLCILAAIATGLPALVRIPEISEAAILTALDLGAAGVMVPHVQNAGQAARAVSAAKYAGRRGFSNSPRAGDYGLRPIAPHAKESDASVAVIAMIEDMAGIDNIPEIAAVDGIDALFIGRVDLTIALGRYDVGHPDVEAAVQRIFAAAPQLGKPLGALADSPALCPPLHENGVRMFLLGTDQGLLRGAVSNTVSQAKAALP
ncbi:HpcH/HpaI aldolase family protein [Azospirillum doebereinerae]|uniref:Aldolase n=1 Tax=Azospirillum doebereinerae TaxID=92933 RepID=A0A3S0WIE7_9PROT|nr:aldolase/citrate lyase family protein [Azospirillum doebereinerae]RUQ63073.1 aldolase [Azospirillum doebereinerae]